MILIKKNYKLVLGLVVKLIENLFQLFVLKKDKQLGLKDIFHNQNKLRILAMVSFYIGNLYKKTKKNISI